MSSGEHPPLTLRVDDREWAERGQPCPTSRALTRRAAAAVGEMTSGSVDPRGVVRRGNTSTA